MTTTEERWRAHDPGVGEDLLCGGGVVLPAVRAENVPGTIEVDVDGRVRTSALRRLGHR